MSVTIKAENVTHAFGNRLLFENLSFSFRPGSVTAVVGANGAGKTTLFRILLGFLAPKSGKIYLCDGNGAREMRSVREKERFQTISYVAQVNNGPNSYTVFESVLFGLSGYLPFFALPSEKDTAAVNEVLRLFSLEELKDRKLSTLSGGEKQLVMIARAMVKKPALLLLDEPEGGLDFTNRVRIMKTLRSLAENGCTVVLNTHHLEDVFRYADDCLLLGEESRFGSTEEVLTEANIEKAFRTKVKICETDGGKRKTKVILPVD